MVKINKKIIKAYALKNALEHKGVAVAGAVVNSLFNQGLKKENIKSLMPDILEVLKEVNDYDEEVKKKEFEKLEDLIGHRVVREGLQELPNVGKKGVIMRFSPSPSGPMHIGHALTSSLSYLYVKKYGGKLIIRIEDTNPENIYKPAYKMIVDEAKWLFDDKDFNLEFMIQSERLEVYYNYAEKFIKKDSAYVCICDTEKFRELIKDKKPCACRKLSVKENLERWKRMLDKSKEGYRQGEAVLRFKTPSSLGGIKHRNVAMRDFPLARINEFSHPLQKNKFRVWPLMNLSVTVDDIESKMTHIIRAKEHRDNASRQEMMYKVLGKKFPWVGFLGRIHFKDFELSASQMRKDVEAGKYAGWDDKKLPTIASLKKQGYKPQAFHKFAEQIGLKEVDKVMDKKEFLLLLDGFNKEKK